MDGLGFKPIRYGYRVYSGYEHDRKTTALHVIAHEENELGNNLGIHTRVIRLLAAAEAMARDLVWVTLNRADAERYLTSPDDCIELMRFEEAYAIGQDPDGGVLVWVAEPEATGKIESLVRQLEQFEPPPADLVDDIELQAVIAAFDRLLAMTNWHNVVMDIEPHQTVVVVGERNGNGTVD